TVRSPLNDHGVLPYGRVGWLKAGRSAVYLSARPAGKHCHADHLNLNYWSDGVEVLTDLGYLWDDHERHLADRTLAHNLVLATGREQRVADRRPGTFSLIGGAA